MDKEHLDPDITMVDQNPATLKVKNKDTTILLSQNSASMASATHESTNTNEGKINEASATTPASTPFWNGHSLKETFLQPDKRKCIELQPGDVHHECIEGAFFTSFSERVQQQMDENEALTIIIRPLGRKFNYRILENKLSTLWKLKGGFKMVDLSDGFYKCKMSMEDDYYKVLLQGPWSTGGHYITVYPYSRNFDTKAEHIDSVATWIRIPGLPTKYFHEALLREITKPIGFYIKADHHTLEEERGQFARVAVSLDLRKKLVPTVTVDGRTYLVSYEDLHRICILCGSYGHIAEECSNKTSEVQQQQNQSPGVDTANTQQQSTVTQSLPTQNSSEPSTGTKPAPPQTNIQRSQSQHVQDDIMNSQRSLTMPGPWLIAQKKSRRQPSTQRPQTEKNYNNTAGKHNASLSLFSRFEVLGPAEDKSNPSVPHIPNLSQPHVPLSTEPTTSSKHKEHNGPKSLSIRKPVSKRKASNKHKEELSKKAHNVQFSFNSQPISSTTTSEPIQNIPSSSHTFTLLPHPATITATNEEQQYLSTSELNRDSKKGEKTGIHVSHPLLIANMKQHDTALLESHNVVMHELSQEPQSLIMDESDHLHLLSLIKQIIWHGNGHLLVCFQQPLPMKQSLIRRIAAASEAFESIQFCFVPRTENLEADALAKLAFTNISYDLQLFQNRPFTLLNSQSSELSTNPAPIHYSAAILEPSAARVEELHCVSRRDRREIFFE